MAYRTQTRPIQPLSSICIASTTPASNRSIPCFWLNMSNNFATTFRLKKLELEFNAFWHSLGTARGMWPELCCELWWNYSSSDGATKPRTSLDMQIPSPSFERANAKSESPATACCYKSPPCAAYAELIYLPWRILALVARVWIRSPHCYENLIRSFHKAEILNAAGI
jgi:hypothetical protein